MTYKDLLEKEIPEMLKECSVKDWDGYGSDPVSPIALQRSIEIIKKLESIGVSAPHISADNDGCVELEWHWSKGDWRIAVEKQERYVWDIIIEIVDQWSIKGSTILFYVF